ncbi:MAG TPA: DUF4388 domain-containing protein [Pyrinomonadaceae bacterium]|jgi:TonB family protein|nr:DUF4388 domain-containing protein [Pyrinomonadaceae bacterium]
MALTGQLSDMSLAELIEFFCNQRKTGRLKIDYPRGHSVFFIKDGELVDAKVGALSGVEAVYFSLTLPNAAFDFSPDVEATRRTIDERWTQVVLEGLRRLDEGVSPTEADAFGSWSPSDADLAVMFDQVEHLDAGKPKRAAQLKVAEESSPREDSSRESSTPAPLSLMVEGAGSGGSKKKWMFAAVAASVLLVCAVAGIPLMSRSSHGEAAQPAPAASQSAASQSADAGTASNEAADASADSAPTEAADASAAANDATRRDELERERRDRERRKREQDALKANDPAAADASALKPATPAPAAPAGPKSVRVTITYDEAGRVTQASVAGATPGAEAYGSTAVRIARGRHFPAGKAGSTVVTIPVN